MLCFESNNVLLKLIRSQENQLRELFDKHVCLTITLCLQLHLFTSKLNGNDVGFTVMTFVTVTKELFLTVSLYSSWSF